MWQDYKISQEILSIKIWICKCICHKVINCCTIPDQSMLIQTQPPEVFYKIFAGKHLQSFSFDKVPGLRIMLLTGNLIRKCIQFQKVYINFAEVSIFLQKISIFD